MADLSENPGADDPCRFRLNSFGPFIAVDDERHCFDTRIRKCPLWLGHVPSAMSGILQYRECWTGDWTPELLLYRDAYRRLLDRTENGLCGKLRLPYPDSSGNNMMPAAMIYQYIAVSVLDQFSSSHLKVASSIDAHCDQLFSKYESLLSRTFCDSANFEFGFEFRQPADYQAFTATLEKAGIHNRPVSTTIDLPNRFSDPHTGNDSCVFALNLAYREHLDTFWRRLNDVFIQFRDKGAEFEPINVESVPDHAGFEEFQRGLQTAKRNRRVPAAFRATVFLNRELERRGTKLCPVVVNPQNYQHYRQQILEMQVEVYEPARRSPAEEFDMLFESPAPLSLLLLDNERIAAMAFAGQLGLFRQERGVTTDPFLDDPSVYYSMDLTVSSEYRGGIGSLMKRAMVLLAIEHGVSAIHGRNRDKFAAGMWAINLSLGAYELQHLPNDYQDNEPFRDCIYYRCPLDWDSDIPAEKLQEFSIFELMEGVSLD